MNFIDFCYLLNDLHQDFFDKTEDEIQYQRLKRFYGIHDVSIHTYYKNNEWSVKKLDTHMEFYSDSHISKEIIDKKENYLKEFYQKNVIDVYKKHPFISFIDNHNGYRIIVSGHLFIPNKYVFIPIDFLILFLKKELNELNEHNIYMNMEMFYSKIRLQIKNETLNFYLKETEKPFDLIQRMIQMITINDGII